MSREIDNSTSRHAPFYVFHDPAETTESRHDHDLTPLHFTVFQIPNIVIELR
jgi:hypothetical protein